MDLSMILNNDGGYMSSPAPSPRSPVRASTRWSVDEMRSAVAILSDFQQPEETARETKIPTHDHAKGSERYAVHHVVHEQQQRYAAPVAKANDAGFSGLDLLFQADAMIQKSVSPDTRPSKPKPKTIKSSTTKKATKKKSTREMDDHEEEEDEEEEEEDEEEESTASSPKYLRSGFWTRAEEEYAAAIIFYFLRGALPIAEGTTLRKYLAEQLCCNRRRVSMKLATEAIADKKIPRKVGASVFVALKPTPSAADRREVDDILTRLRRDCFREMEEEVAQLDENTGKQRQRAGSPLVVSPLVLSTKTHSDAGSPHSEFSLGTPTRRHRKSPKKQPQRQRRGSVSSFSSTAKPSPPQIKRRRPLIIRTGFDSPQEEEFVTALVESFMEGTLELEDGVRLVSYLCSQLDCSAKTLSMKLAPRKMGEHKFPDNIGSITFTRKEDDDASSEIFETESRVFELRQNWIQARENAEELEQQQQGELPSKQDTKPLFSTPVLTPSRKIKSESTHSSRTTTSTPPARTKYSKKGKESPSYTRSGPWSRHEEEFAAALIDCFFRGVLDVTEGTTLRAYLTSRLHCNPMRISKKLASHAIADVKIPKKLGSATYVQRDSVPETERRAAEARLRRLEHLSLSHQQLKDDLLGSVTVSGRKHSRGEDDDENENDDYRAEEELEEDEEEVLEEVEEKEDHRGYYHAEQPVYQGGEAHHRRGLFHGPSGGGGSGITSSYERKHELEPEYYHHPHHHHHHHAPPSSSYASSHYPPNPISPLSPFKMARRSVDDHATSRHQSHHPHHPHAHSHAHGHAHIHSTSGPTTSSSSSYDHHDASMRFQRVAY